MTAKDVWEAVNELDGKDMDKGTRVTLEALVKDGEEMNSRMTSLTSKVDAIDNKVDNIDNKVDALTKSMNDFTEKLSQRQNGWKFLSELIKEPKFWVWFIILTVLAYGVSITDLKGLLP